MNIPLSEFIGKYNKNQHSSSIFTSHLAESRDLTGSPNDPCRCQSVIIGIFFTILSKSISRAQ